MWITEAMISKLTNLGVTDVVMHGAEATGKAWTSMMEDELRKAASASQGDARTVRNPEGEAP